MAATETVRRSLPRFRVEQETRGTRTATIVLAVAFALLAAMPVWGNASLMRLLVEFFTLLAMAQMWNLLAGYAGLVSIGQQAFVGIGAYGLLLLTDRLALHPVLAVAGVGVAAAVVAGATALFAFRLRDGYFAIGTWVIAEVFRLLFANWQEVGAGTGISLGSVSRIPVEERQALTFWLALVLGFGSVVVTRLIMRSRIGLGLRAIRDSETAAGSVGVDAFRAKVIVYLVASTVCALAGAVLFMQLLRIQPNAAFSVDFSARMIFVVVIGGLGSIEGPILGAIAFFLLQETLADFGSLYVVILGLVAIGVTILARGGLWGLLARRYPMSLFGVQSRLIIQPTTGETSEGT